VAVPVLVLTPHARTQMAARNISEDILRDIVQKPQQRLTISEGRQIYQSQYFDTIDQKPMLMRIVVEPQGENLIVVSVYKTSRIGKYWLEGSEA
jgi:hypothetical protein